MESSINWDAVTADLIVILHFSYVIFVLLGGVLLLWWRKLAWIHVPAVVWGILVELTGWICPLTKYENQFRHHAGLQMYDGDFVMRYIMPVLYPEDLTRSLQVSLGIIILIINLLCYYYVFWFTKDKYRSTSSDLSKEDK